MKTIKYTACSGEETINPDIQQLKSLVRTGGSDYWEGGSGEALIEYTNEQKSTKLYIMMSEGYGFYLEYCNDKAYVTMADKSFEEITKVYVGGDPIPVPKSFFLSIEETERQVEEFLNTGEVNHCVKWVEKNSTGWNYGEITETTEKEKRCKSVEEIAARNSKVRRKWQKNI